jgi:hypothetical protein
MREIPGKDYILGPVRSDHRHPFGGSIGALCSEDKTSERADGFTAVLKVTGGKVSGQGGAAELLGIKPTTLASCMASLGIEKSGSTV